MSFSSDLYTFLTADSALAVLVGTRIHPNRVSPNETFPFIRLHTIATETQRDLSTFNKHRAPIIQFSIFSRSYDNAISIRERLMALFDGYRGATGSTFIQSVFFEGDSETWEDANPEGHHHFTIDFKFIYNV